MTIAGCAMANSPVFGPLYTGSVRGPVSMGDGSVAQSKTGRATATAVFGIGTGDASIEAAATAGAISKIHHVDCEAFNLLGIYTTYTTIVYGQ
jgi:hypothetical protein